MIPQTSITLTAEITSFVPLSPSYQSSVTSTLRIRKITQPVQITEDNGNDSHVGNGNSFLFQTCWLENVCTQTHPVTNTTPFFLAHLFTHLRHIYSWQCNVLTALHTCFRNFQCCHPMRRQDQNRQTNALDKYQNPTYVGKSQGLLRQILVRVKAGSSWNFICAESSECARRTNATMSFNPPRALSYSLCWFHLWYLETFSQRLQHTTFQHQHMRTILRISTDQHADCWFQWRICLRRMSRSLSHCDRRLETRWRQFSLVFLCCVQ